MERRAYNMFTADLYLAPDEKKLAEELTECIAKDFMNEKDFQTINKLKELYSDDDANETIRKFLIVRKVKKLRFYMSFYVAFIKNNISKILDEMSLFLSQDEIDELKNDMVKVTLNQYFDESWGDASSFIYRAMLDALSTKED